MSANEPVRLGTQLLSPAAVKLRIAQVSPSSQGGTVYCAYQTLGIEDERAYLWVLCMEFRHGEDDPLSGTSLPVVLDRDTIHVPRDGSLYVRDIKHLFPARLIPLVLVGSPNESNARVAALEAAIADERSHASHTSPLSGGRGTGASGRPSWPSSPNESTPLR